MATVEASLDAAGLANDEPSTGGGLPAMRFGLRRLFEALTCTAIVAWAVNSSWTAYEVYGVVQSGFVWAAVVLGGIATLPLLFALRTRTVIRIWMIALVAFSLGQTVLTRRLSALQSEVASIIDYVDDYKLQHGLYPTNLSGYDFHRPDLASYIEYRDAYPTTSYEIRWHPIRLHGIAHWYGADYGHYYEDD
jgi:hypothetical protein